MSNEEKPLVSVLCLTYNHEKSIAQCLDGFVDQKTNFKYEVLVHDDCSTDGTLDIVLSYEKKYPDLFMVITEEENQYSKGVDIYDDIMMPLASGKYIALCEGDDYWSGSHKLQKQFNFMESHPECSLVCHNTMVHYMNGMKPDALMNSWSDIHRLSEDDIFICWDVHTSSYFLRRECFGRKEYQRKFSRIFEDYIELCNAADCGDIYSLPEIMSVYNFQNPESLTVTENKDIRSSLELIENRIKFLKEYDEHTSHRHSEVILKRLNAQIEKMKKIIKTGNPL